MHGAIGSIMPSNLELYGDINAGANIIFVTNRLENAIVFKTDYEKHEETKSQKRENIPNGVNLIVNGGSSRYQYFKNDSSFSYYTGKPKREIELTYRGKAHELKFPGEDKVVDIVLADNEVLHVSFIWQKPGWDVTVFSESNYSLLQLIKDILSLKFLRL